MKTDKTKRKEKKNSFFPYSLSVQKLRSNFGRCFAFFTLSDQLDPQQKHFLRVEEMQRADWLIICWGTGKFVARQVVSLMKNEKQNQNLLLKVDPRSTFRNNFLQL